MVHTSTILCAVLATCLLTFVSASSSFSGISTSTLTVSGDDNVLTFTKNKVDNISFSLTFVSAQPTNNGTSVGGSIDLSGGSWDKGSPSNNASDAEVYTAKTSNGNFVFSCDLFKNSTTVDFTNSTVKVTDNSLKIAMNISDFDFPSGSDTLEVTWVAAATSGNATAFHGSGWDVTSVFVGDSSDDFYLWLNFPLFGSVDGGNATTVGVSANSTKVKSVSGDDSPTVEATIVIQAPKFKDTFYYDPDISVQDNTSVTMSSSPKDKSLLYIIFAVIGGFVLACLVAITVIIFLRSRKRAQYEAV